MEIKKSYQEIQHKIFLTGGTGLIGSYLLKILLENNNKVYVLARSGDNKNAKKRLLDVLKFWSYKVVNNLNNLVVLEGNITKKNLGLDKQSINLLENEIEEIFHCAAVTQFNWPLKEIRKVNVGGTRTVLKLAVKCNEKGRLKKVNHLSTAYVCGDYKGIFKEDNLDVGQKFYTPYEQSKFETEKLVNNFRKLGLWIDVFRPPMVLGETNTGKTLSFNQAFYQAIRFLSLGILEYLPCRGMQLNLVYLDDLCKSIFYISSNTHVRNKNYHVFNSKAASAVQLLNFFYKFFGIKKPKFLYPDMFIKNKATPITMMLLKYNFLFLNRKTKFDSIFTNKLLSKYGFIFSEYDEKKFSKILGYTVNKKFLNIIR